MATRKHKAIVRTTGKAVLTLSDVMGCTRFIVVVRP